MPQFDQRTTQFLNDSTLIAQAGQKVLDVIAQGTMRWRFEETVVFCRVAVNLVRRARTGFHPGLKIVEVRLNGVQLIVETHTTTPIQHTRITCQSQGHKAGPYGARIIAVETSSCRPADLSSIPTDVRWRPDARRAQEILRQLFAPTRRDRWRIGRG
jgi:hypothetical protein